MVALLLFVGIPLPGTGAWTGTLAGSVQDMKFKDVVKACMGGVLLAGIIMGLASAGLLPMHLKNPITADSFKIHAPAGAKKVKAMKNINYCLI